MKNSLLIFCIGLLCSFQSFATIHTLQEGERDINRHAWSFPSGDIEVDAVPEKAVEKRAAILPKEKKAKKAKENATAIKHELAAEEVREQLSQTDAENVKQTEANEIGLEIYPNPVRSSFTLLIEQPLTNASLEIHDMSGRLVFEDTFLTMDKKHIVVCSDLQPGWYILNLHSENSSALRRILKE